MLSIPRAPTAAKKAMCGSASGLDERSPIVRAIEDVGPTMASVLQDLRDLSQSPFLSPGFAVELQSNPGRIVGQNEPVIFTALFALKKAMNVVGSGQLMAQVRTAIETLQDAFPEWPPAQDENEAMMEVVTAAENGYHQPAPEPTPKLVPTSKKATPKEPTPKKATPVPPKPATPKTPSVNGAIIVEDRQPEEVNLHKLRMQPPPGARKFKVGDLPEISEDDDESAPEDNKEEEQQEEEEEEDWDDSDEDTGLGKHAREESDEKGEEDFLMPTAKKPRTEDDEEEDEDWD